MARKKNNNENEDLKDFDFGNIELPEVDLSMFDLIGENEAPEESRYTKPKIYPMKQEFITYDNAEKLARELTVNKGERADVFVSGSFIFGDFLEAYIVQRNAKCLKMTVTTLSLSQENVDSLYNLVGKNYVDELNLIVSAYFFAHERHSLIPYIYEKLDIDNKFQLAVASIHTKTAQFETLGGRKIVIHGSANLRSSANIEQFTIEENEELYTFYDEHFGNIIARYATINKKKPIRDSELWDVFTRKKFNN
jgi:hypothetical protein